MKERHLKVAKAREADLLAEFRDVAAGKTPSVVKIIKVAA